MLKEIVCLLFLNPQYTIIFSSSKIPKRLFFVVRNDKNVKKEGKKIFYEI